MSEVPVKTYKLPMSADYIRHWGLAEAVRELLQNYIDSPESGSLTWGKDSLAITNNDVTIPSSSLVLGGTTKADNDAMIGAFGEGFKLALLVLVRLGYGVKVLNGKYLWSPYMKMDDQFHAEILHIDETYVHDGLRSLSFVIDGLSEEDRAIITDSCLLLQKPDADLIDTKCGQILPSRPGELFVGGLHICSTELKFGYNFKPEVMRLDRDRQTVGDIELKFATKDMWYATEDWDRIAVMMKDKVPDLDMAKHYNVGFVKEACYKLFMKQHPGKIIADSQEELDRCIRAGLGPRTVYIDAPGYAHNIKTHPKYKNNWAEQTRAKTPMEDLQKFYNDNSSLMKLELKTKFKSLIEAATAWKK